MKKILIVNDHFPPHHWGGANSVAYLQAKGLKERGYEVLVLATAQKKEEAGDSVYKGIPVRTIYTEYHPRWWAWRSLYNPPAVSAFKNALEQYHPDIIHFHNIHHYFSYRCIAVAKQTKAKVFLTAHDVMSFAYRKLRPGPYRVSGWRNLRDARKRFNPFRNVGIRHYLRQVHIFAVSVALKEALLANRVGKGITVVHNGIDAANYACAPTSQKTILYVGRFTPDKGRDVLLRALAQVRKQVPAARLLVIGHDPNSVEPAMDRLIKELDIAGAVQLLPPVPYPEMPQVYCQAAVVAVPSIIFDSFPTANLEAMAAGRPVVATCFGGSSESVEDGITGYIVNPLEIDTLAQRLCLLLENPTLAHSMGEAGHRRLEQQFTLAHQLDQYIAYY